MTKAQRARERDRKAAIDAIGAGDMFFSRSQVITHWDQYPEMDMDPFDDDLSGENGHR